MKGAEALTNDWIDASSTRPVAVTAAAVTCVVALIVPCDVRPAKDQSGAGVRRYYGRRTGGNEITSVPPSWQLARHDTPQHRSGSRLADESGGRTLFTIKATILR